MAYLWKPDVRSAQLHATIVAPNKNQYLWHVTKVSITADGIDIYSGDGVKHYPPGTHVEVELDYQEIY